MSNSLKDKYGLNVETSSDDSESLDIRPEEYQAFRKDTQVRPDNALIDFWLRGGRQRAFSYSHLYDIDFNPSEGMTLTFSEHLVVIKGHGLDKLYSGLKRHRIVYVWEANSSAELLADETEPIVRSIEFQQRFEQEQSQP